MSSIKTLNKVKQLLGIEVKLEQMKLENGTILEAEAFEVDNEVFILMDGERVPVPAGDYVLENGQTMTVNEMGVIASIGEAETEVEAETEQPADAPAKKVIESVTKEVQFDEQIAELRAEIEDLKNTINLSKEEKQEIKPIKHNPEAAAKRVVNMNSQGTTTKARLYEFLNNRK